MKIKQTALQQGVELYDAAVKIFLGQMVEKYGLMSAGRLEQWVDVAGLLAPKSEIDNFIAQMCTDRSLSIVKVGKMLASLHSGYEKWCNEWCGAAIEQEYANHVTSEEIISIGAKAKIWLLKAVLNDAAKEFSPAATVGFGKDSDRIQDKEIDIESVRGALEDNSLVCSLIEEILSLEGKI